MNPDCVFCQIVGESEADRPSRAVLDTGYWIAIKPVGPVADGHMLLIPHKHVERLDDQLGSYAMADLPFALKEVLRVTGATDYNLGINAGEFAGQTVFHLHIHVIPREEGDVEDPAGGIIRPLGQILPDSEFEDYLRSRR